MYDEFNELSALRLAHPEVSHLFELPESYTALSASVRAAAGTMDESRRQQLLIQERSAAIRVFSMFEQAVYQRTQALRQKDSTRAAFLDEVLGYLTGTLFRNPRLAFLWSREGGNLCGHYEAETIEFYEERVQVPDEAIDSEGPFGGRIG